MGRNPSCRPPARAMRLLGPLLVGLGTLGLALPLLSPIVFAQNQTPRKLNAIIFAPSVQDSTAPATVERLLCAEHYTVERYEGNAASLSQLVAISRQPCAVLVIMARGSHGSLYMEEGASKDAAKAKYAAYVADTTLGFIKDDISWTTMPRIANRGASTPRYGIQVYPAGLNKLFGGTDSNRGIAILLFPDSWDLQRSRPGGVFGATDVLGIQGWHYGFDEPEATPVIWGLLSMGGLLKIPDRPIMPAFYSMKLDGPENTTLSPACTAHLPADEAVLPLSVKTDGSTDYETTMDVGNSNIMEASGCGAAITDQAWTSNVHHVFKVESATKGRLILKVTPTVAVSANNENQLVGNLYVIGDFGDFDDALHADYTQPRPEVSECPFGMSGLDGARPCVAPEIPFRWCLWCGEHPTEPVSPHPPEDMDDTNILPRLLPFFERDAFTLYQDSPGPNTTFTTSPLPPNMTFTQMGSWYGHVIFTPDASQVGQQYDVTFTTFDVNGQRAQRTITWQVPARLNDLSLHSLDYRLLTGDLGMEAVSPADTVRFTAVLSNSGNTRIEQVAIHSPGLFGPQVVPVTVSPSYYSPLEPGDAIVVQLEAVAPPGAPVGLYTGTLDVDGLAADGPVHREGTFSVRVDHPPMIAAPAETLHVVPGGHVSAPVTFSDLDADTLTTDLGLAPFDAELVSTGPGSASFEWSPPLGARGTFSIPIVSWDGHIGAGRDLVVQVDATTAVDSPVPHLAFSAGPNPATSTVRFALELDHACRVQLGVYDPSGRLVAQPIRNELVGPGLRSWSWQPSRLESGIYFVRVRAGNYQEQRRLIWLGGRSR